jgi:hypothetical protein
LTSQIAWTVVIALVVIVAASATYALAELLGRVEITDADLRSVTPLRVTVIPRTRIAGLVCCDVVGLIPHVMRFAILHDGYHHALLTLDRRHWSDYTLHRLEEVMGLPISLNPQVMSFRQFRREWRR